MTMKFLLRKQKVGGTSKVVSSSENKPQNSFLCSNSVVVTGREAPSFSKSEDWIIRQRVEEFLCLQEENRLLQNRLNDLEQGVHEVQKENSLLKMKATITLGNMRLEIDSLQDDRNALIEKYFDLKRKTAESVASLEMKERELAALKVTRHVRAKSL
jgi:hypothetical protein